MKTIVGIIGGFIGGLIASIPWIIGSVVFATIGLSSIIRNTISEVLNSKKPEFTENADEGIERESNENDEKI